MRVEYLGGPCYVGNDYRTRGETSVPGLLFYLGFLLGCEGPRRKSQFFLKVLVSPQASNMRTLRDITFPYLAIVKVLITFKIPQC